jgi:hypothetical protein
VRVKFLGCVPHQATSRLCWNRAHTPPGLIGPTTVVHLFGSETWCGIKIRL